MKKNRARNSKKRNRIGANAPQTRAKTARAAFLVPPLHPVRNYGASNPPLAGSIIRIGSQAPHATCGQPRADLILKPTGHIYRPKRWCRRLSCKKCGYAARDLKIHEILEELEWSHIGAHIVASHLTMKVTRQREKLGSILKSLDLSGIIGLHKNDGSDRYDLHAFVVSTEGATFNEVLRAVAQWNKERTRSGWRIKVVPGPRNTPESRMKTLYYIFDVERFVLGFGKSFGSVVHWFNRISKSKTISRVRTAENPNEAFLRRLHGFKQGRRKLSQWLCDPRKLENLRGLSVLLTAERAFTHDPVYRAALNGMMDGFHKETFRRKTESQTLLRGKLLLALAQTWKSAYLIVRGHYRRRVRRRGRHLAHRHARCRVRSHLRRRTRI